MTSSSGLRPQEFGDKLALSREEAGVNLDAIVVRTKISKRQLLALETGDFAKLPGRAFARMFLKQYLTIVGEEPEAWLNGFEAAWQHFQDSSASFPALSAVPAERRRTLPWILGLVIVASAFVAVILVVRERPGADVAGTTIVRATPLSLTPPPAVVTEVVPTPAAVPEPPVLVIRSLGGPCWVKVAGAHGMAESRLLGSAEEWSVGVGDEGVDLTLGDAGAVEISFAGRVIEHAGKPGEVVHLHVGAEPGIGGSSVPRGSDGRESTVVEGERQGQR